MNREYGNGNFVMLCGGKTLPPIENEIKEGYEEIEKLENDFLSRPNPEL